MSSAVQQQIFLNHWKRRSLGIAGIATLLCLVGFYTSKQTFLIAYLQSYCFWLPAAMGCLGLGLLHNLVGGLWGNPLRGYFNAATKTVPLLLVLFIPILLGFTELYVWARPEAAHDALLVSKSGYLNKSGYFTRLILYFAVWIGLGFWVRSKSRMSGLGMVLFILAVSFAAFDWLMSLEPHWFSSIYGAIFLIDCLVTSLAFLILLRRFLNPDYDKEPDHLHDMGKLLLMSVMIWAYFNFSQYLIIWSGKLAEELSWYQHRMNGGWRWVGLIVILFHFAVPFLLLLSRDLKRKSSTLGMVALGLLVMRCVDLWWMVTPAFSPGVLSFHWVYFVPFFAVGGVWLATFFHFLQQEIAKAPEVIKSEGAHGPQDK